MQAMNHAKERFSQCSMLNRFKLLIQSRKHSGDSASASIQLHGCIQSHALRHWLIAGFIGILVCLSGCTTKRAEPNTPLMVQQFKPIHGGANYRYVKSTQLHKEYNHVLLQRS